MYILPQTYLLPQVDEAGHDLGTLDGKRWGVWVRFVHGYVTAFSCSKGISAMWQASGHELGLEKAP